MGLSYLPASGRTNTGRGISPGRRSLDKARREPLRVYERWDHGRIEDGRLARWPGLLDYPDGALAGVAAAELAGHVAATAARVSPSGVLVFDDIGVAGHPDYRAATGAAVLAGRQAGLPVLAWTLPAAVAARLSAETGQGFRGQPPDRIDLCLHVSRQRQRRAALLHATQVSPAAVLWRRLQLLGDCEHLRWLVPPQR